MRANVVRPLLATLAAVAAVAAPLALAAQEPAVGAVRGVVWDSLARRPLAGARVWTADGLRSTVADSAGRFALDSVAVAAGPVALLAEHPAADSVGLATLAAAVPVAAGRTTEATIAIPGYATLRAAACRGIADAGDREGGVLFGTVRSADGAVPVQGAVVELSWLTFKGAQGFGASPADVVVQSLDALTDATGTFYACGVPTTTDVLVRATATVGDAAGGAADSLTSSDVTVLVGQRRIRRRDVLVGPADGDAASRAVVVARVVADDGRPVAGANVHAGSDAPVVANDDGVATLGRVAPGTRVVTARRVGFTPAARTVDLLAGETTHVELRLTDVPVELETMRVRAVRTLQDVEQRTLGGGYAVTGERLARSTTLAAIFHQVPAVRVDGSGPFDTRLLSRSPHSGGWCAMSIYVDGRKSMIEELQLFAPEDFVAVEVYPRATQAPAQYVRPEDLAGCGVILAWLRR